MPKSIEVSPLRLDNAGKLPLPEIPLYQYTADLSAEQQKRGNNTLVAVLRHMLIVREFESMLNAIRSTGEYAGVNCKYSGPAHLSVGQEASAVGMALALTPSDHIFGNHRSHGEFLAKGLAAIDAFNENQLGELMSAHRGGSLLRVVERTLGGSGKKLSENFLLFGFLSEILMRSTGFNLGMGGSMHAFFPPFGAYPNNAIVGGSAGIATGAALRKRQTGDGITVSISGDGSTGCGQVWEAMNFASMAQFQTLWNDAQSKGLPVLFLFNNNFYAMGGQTIGETMGWDHLSRIGAGINPSAMHAETVDGTNPLAVADAVERKRQLLLAGDGPALLDIECYRQSGHSTSDANAYRSREEISQWAQHDPIERYAGSLLESSIVSESEVEQMRTEVQQLIKEVLIAAGDTNNAPVVDLKSHPTFIGDLMFNNTSLDLSSGTARTDAENNTDAASKVDATNTSIEAATAKPEVDPASCSRVRQNAKKARHGIDDEGKTLSPMRAITLRDALFESILHHMLHDKRLIAYGEECREWGGAFGVYRGLSDLFPHSRVFNSPISEATIVSSAVGYAMEGGRALIELMYADFIGRAGDEIFNQMAKWQAMSAGELSIPVVLRCSIGSKYGAQHSQDWASLLTHIPGLKVIYPATPYAAKGLMAAALSSNDPVVMFESQRLYDTTETLQEGGVPEQYYTLPIGEPALIRKGDALTMLTIGPCLHTAIAAADVLQQQHNLGSEIIDARSLVPFNYQPVLNSVAKTGRLLIVSEACERNSFAMTLATNVTRFSFASLQAAPQVLGAPNWIVPGAEMESGYFVQIDDILSRIARDFYPDAGIDVRGNRSWDDMELARRGL